MDDIFNGYGIAIELLDEDGFLKIKETLSRIGVASIKTDIDNPLTVHKVLFPSVYLLHKRGFYRILHFKELFALDKKPTNISENDIARRNTIALLLQDWGLLKINNTNSIKENTVDLNQIKILTYKEKPDWIISHKYSVGKKRVNFNQ